VAGTKLPGFYLCGGGTHPGAGVAMAAISGRLAAERVLEDRP
jgi:1-hydroxycarotenoid 3,4-desaturase